MREIKNYAVSNQEIMQKIKNCSNPVTICTYKNILKSRTKRCDEDALYYYTMYVSERVKLDTSKELKEIYEKYMMLDSKQRDIDTSFEDFEKAIFY